MNKLTILAALIVPGKTGTVSFEETAVPGSYIAVDPTKTILPRGRAFLKLEQSASKGASRGMVRFQVPHLSKDGETEAAVTEHQVCTTERDALRGGVRAIDESGNVTDTAEGAAFVAHRLLTIFTAAPATSLRDQVNGQVVVDDVISNDPTGLASTDASVRFGNPYVRGQNGLPMVTVGPSGLVGTTTSDVKALCVDPMDV